MRRAAHPLRPTPRLQRVAAARTSLLRHRRKRVPLTVQGAGPALNRLPARRIDHPAHARATFAHRATPTTASAALPLHPASTLRSPCGWVLPATPKQHAPSCCAAGAHDAAPATPLPRHMASLPCEALPLGPMRPCNTALRPLHLLCSAAAQHTSPDNSCKPIQNADCASAAVQGRTRRAQRKLCLSEQ